MNLDAEISRLSALIKQDASIHTKWRNKAIERLNEAQAYILMGRHTTNMKPPEGFPVNPHDIAPNAKIGVCICRPGVVDRACLLHGGGV